MESNFMIAILSSINTLTYDQAAARLSAFLSRYPKLHAQTLRIGCKC